MKKYRSLNREQFSRADRNRLRRGEEARCVDGRPRWTKAWRRRMAEACARIRDHIARMNESARRGEK